MGLLAESEKRHWKRVIEALEETVASERRRSNKLTNQLRTNADTGLPNSQALREELESILEGSPDSKAVLFVALDETFWKLKRGELSTRVPEWILFQTFVRIQEILEDRGRIYHTHEHEFLILIESFRHPGEIDALARKLVDAVQVKHKLGNLYFSIGVNVGIALFPEHGRRKSTLLRHADIALSESIRTKVPYILYTPELKDQMVASVSLQKEILSAIEAQADPNAQGQFSLYLQPQVEIRNWGTPQVQGRVVGAEALLRWHNPFKDGMVPPSVFIPVAEETGLIVPLGQWILRRAVVLIRDLQQRGFHHLAVSVNFSSKQFDAKDLHKSVIDIVKKAGIDPSGLKLEITESGLMGNIQETLHKGTALQDAGFKILVDDFGTKYSSLSYLKDLPIDVVKIDKSFVDGLPDDPGDQALCKAIIVLARDLNKGIIVEGTEDQRQIDWLYKQGCTVFQGYYFSKPLPYLDFLKYLADFPALFEERANAGTEVS